VISDELLSGVGPSGVFGAALVEHVRPAWWNTAACRNEPLELFYPPDGRGRRPDWSAPAAVCAACPVVDVCRADGDALEVNAERRCVAGFRAGESPADRISRRNAGRIGEAA
jgi:hypothetical protein